MNILVTGGAGYIGSHACKAIAASGLRPVSYDNLSRGHREAVKWGPLEVGDVGDTGRVREVLQSYQPIAVMHFSAFAYVGESVANPLLYYRNNTGATAALLQAIRDYQPLPFVFSSTCATYGVPDNIPISESHPQRPINAYGRSKLVVEWMLEDCASAYGLRWAALRYFNAAGSDPDGEIGETHDPETHLIPLALNAARDGTTLQIFGTDYDTPDGTCVRDYVHVADIAAGHLQALDYLLKGGASAAFNLANERGYSVREVIATAEQVSRRVIHSEVAPRRDGDPPILIGSAQKARQMLGWKPIRSTIEHQIEDAWRWTTSARKPT
jgi:UDP-arabinose 4-epimerase